ncbi:hypothetical protein H0X10_03215 [Candidatus Saccharibacteria bacterium]|nr:hypothetical protein [Candidatus Saccharibacteria bacterium]
MANSNNLTQSELKTYQVGVIQAAAVRALKKHKDSCLQPYGLTGMQWCIIGTVLDTGPKGIRITDLANKVDATMAFLTNTVNLLESKNVLERIENANDNRSRMVRVTKKFQPNCQKIENELRRKLRTSFYSKVTPDELDTYIRVLNRFSELS